MSKQPDSGPVVALLGHTGNENLGDEAITEATIENLSKRLPGVTFKLFSIVPTDTQARHGYPAYPLRPTEDATISSLLYRNWTAVKSGGGGLAPLYEREGWDYTEVVWAPTIKNRIRLMLDLTLNAFALWRNERRFDRENLARLEGVDLMVFTGSNQFLDNFGGPWAFPFTLKRWAKLAHRSATPLAFASIGAGPIYDESSIKMIRDALSHADYVSVRDKPSKALLQRGGCKNEIHVAPDLAFSLPERVAAKPVDWSRPVIAINPMPIYSSVYWYVSDPEQYENFVNALADIALHLRDADLPFFFFSTQPKDQLVMDDVFARLAERGHTDFDAASLMRISENVGELQGVLGSADIIVATRFHGTVIGLHSKKMVMSTSYYRKAADVLEEFGLGDYAFQIEDLKSADVISRIEQLMERHTDHETKVESMQQRYQQELDTQYDALAKLIKR